MRTTSTIRPLAFYANQFGGTMKSLVQDPCIDSDDTIRCWIAALQARMFSGRSEKSTWPSGSCVGQDNVPQ